MQFMEPHEDALRVYYLKEIGYHLAYLPPLKTKNYFENLNKSLGVILLNGIQEHAMNVDKLVAKELTTKKYGENCGQIYDIVHDDQSEARLREYYKKLKTRIRKVAKDLNFNKNILDSKIGLNQYEKKVVVKKKEHKVKKVRSPKGERLDHMNRSISHNLRNLKKVKESKFQYKSRNSNMTSRSNPSRGEIGSGVIERNSMRYSQEYEFEDLLTFNKDDPFLSEKEIEEEELKAKVINCD